MTMKMIITRLCDMQCEIYEWKQTFSQPKIQEATRQIPRRVKSQEGAGLSAEAK